MTLKGTRPINKESKLHSAFKGFLPLYVFAHFAHHVMTAMPQPLAPFIQREFNLSYTRITLVQSAFAWSYGVAQVPAGFLADRIGQKTLLIIGISGMAVGGILVGLSQSYMMLLVFMVLMGILGGGYHPAAAPLVSNAVPLSLRGRALGFHEIGASASFLVAPLIAASIASASEWRNAYIWLAIPTFLIGLAFLVYMKRPVRREEAIEEHADGSDEVPDRTGRVRRLVAFLVLSIGTGGLVNSVTSLITVYAVNERGATETVAATLIICLTSAGLWVSPIAGYLSDRIGQVRLVIGASLLSAVVIWGINYAPYFWGLAAMMILLGIAQFIRMPVSESFIMGHTTEKNRSTIYGVYYFAMTETGAVFAPLMGLIVDNYGFELGYSLVPVAIVVVTLGTAFFLRGGNR